MGSGATEKLSEIARLEIPREVGVGIFGQPFLISDDWCKALEAFVSTP